MCACMPACCLYLVEQQSRACNKWTPMRRLLDAEGVFVQVGRSSSNFIQPDGRETK